MSHFILRNRHFPSICVAGIMAITLFVFIFQLVAVNASRDAKSDNIRRIERDCQRLREEIKSLEETKARLCNAEVLRCNPAVEKRGLREIPNGQIIRVRPQNVPFSVGSSSTLPPRALAIELSELATLSRR